MVDWLIQVQKAIVECKLILLSWLDYVNGIRLSLLKLQENSHRNQFAHTTQRHRIRKRRTWNSPVERSFSMKTNNWLVHWKEAMLSWPVYDPCWKRLVTLSCSSIDPSYYLRKTCCCRWSGIERATEHDAMDNYHGNLGYSLSSEDFEQTVSILT